MDPIGDFHLTPFEKFLDPPLILETLALPQTPTGAFSPGPIGGLPFGLIWKIPGSTPNFGKLCLHPDPYPGFSPGPDWGTS